MKFPRKPVAVIRFIALALGHWLFTGKAQGQAFVERLAGILACSRAYALGFRLCGHQSRTNSCLMCSVWVRLFSYTPGGYIIALGVLRGKLFGFPLFCFGQLLSGG